MAIFVLILGVLLSIAGLAGYVYGVDMLPTERGMTAVISSVTAIAGGVVAIALSAVIQRMDRLIAANSAKIDTSEAPKPDAVTIDDQSVAAPAVVPEPPRPVVPIQPMLTPDDLVLPDHAPVESIAPSPVVHEPPPSLEPVVEAEAPPKKERFKFRLPASLKLGAGAAIAGGIAATASHLKPEPTPEEMPQALEATQVAVVEEVVAVESELAVQKANADQPFDDEAFGAALTEAPAIEPVLESLKPEELAPVEELTGLSNSGLSNSMSDLEAELEKLIPLKPLKPVAKAKKERPSVELVAKDEPAPVVIPPRLPEPELPTSILADPDDLAPSAPLPVTPPPGAEIVGSYESGGSRYTMYSDGSVIADTNGKLQQFESLEKLRDFIDAGGART